MIQRAGPSLLESGASQVLESRLGWFCKLLSVSRKGAWCHQWCQMLFLCHHVLQVSVSKQFLIIRVYALPPSPTPAHLLRLVSHRPKFLGFVQTDKQAVEEEDKAASKGPQAQEPIGLHSKQLGCVAATSLWASAPRMVPSGLGTGKDERGPLNEGNH